MELMADITGFITSKSEVRRSIQGKGLSINKKVIEGPELRVDTTQLINDKYLLLQKGKKAYFLVITE